MKKRLLPEYVSRFKDRHGKWRLRFRRTGFSGGYFRSEFGTEDFRTEYRAFLDGQKPEIGAERIVPGSLADLLSRYFRSGDFNSGNVTTRLKNRRILENFAEGRRDRKVADVTWEHLDSILTKKAATYPSAARNLRKQLRRMFAFAKRARMIRENPMDDVKVKVRATAGHHTWTEAEIAKFQSHHPLGTLPRLALELMLWTGNRRGDAVLLRKDQIRNGMIDLQQEKGGKKLILPVPQPLADAIAAMPPHDAETILVTAYGKSFSTAGFGNRFREWCDKAGLPHCASHGLRKAIARRLAESGASNQQIKAITGHSQDAEVALYTRMANQEMMARETMDKLELWLSNSSDRLDKRSRKDEQ